MSRYPSGSEASLGQLRYYVSASCGPLARQRTSSTRSAYVTGNHYEPDLVNISIKDAGYFDVHFSGFKEIQ